MFLFPVRHHSPAAARHVTRVIRARRPRAVLVEGPADATPLIPALLDVRTEPPVALYAYRTEGAPRAVSWPFCAYSPEYVALAAAREVGARSAFCDLPASAVLAAGDETGLNLSPAEDYARFCGGLAEAAGYATFDEFWDVVFEQEAADLPSDAFVAALVEFGAKARRLVPRGDEDSVREAQMAAAALRLVDEGIAPEEIVLVCGAAHVEPIAALVAGSAEVEPMDPPTVPAALHLIPFSFPRLSEHFGYGAGNRAPRYYQRVWEAGGDHAVATRAALLALAADLRGAGRDASLAQAIDADTLGGVLARLRGKPAAGVDEIEDAAAACFGQGQELPVAAALRRIQIGETVGRVTPEIGRTPLQTEFYETTSRLGLPVVDAPRQILLHMPIAAEAARSVFLHRLVLAEIPYAVELVSGLGGGGRAAVKDPLDQIARSREKWELAWTPATDGQLVERTALGASFAEVCGRTLADALAAATRIDQGTETLLRMALCDLTEGFDAGLLRCERLAAAGGDFVALGRATFHLDGLAAYGAARRLPAAALATLAARLFRRAAVHLPAAAVCGDEDAVAVRDTLVSLADLVRRASPVADGETFWQALERTAAGAATHGEIRGAILTLLQLGGRLGDSDLAHHLRYWLSATAEPGANARLVAGVFSLHRGTLVRNRPLVAAVNGFLAGLSLATLTPLLPTLRRALGNLGGAERAYLSETLAGVLGVTPSTATRSVAASDVETALLREADALVATTLDDWRERYGIA